MQDVLEEDKSEELEVFGDIPQARFGHTVTLVSNSKAVLFGGATGDTGKYIMTGDTYLFNILNKSWSKLTVKGVPPSPRAAHHSTNVEQMQMVVYGGATGGGSLASDDLFLLDMRNGEDEATWMIVPVVGSTPGRRYGHTIVFSKPHLLVFGGNTGSEAVNDVWCLSVEKAPFSWTKLNWGTNVPPVRVYHSASLWITGSATGMMVIFGGRTSDSSALNDTWGLRRHRDGRWDWVPAPYKTNTNSPTFRYQHSTLFLGPLMVVIGGRTNTVGEVVPLEVYDTESSEWTSFKSLQRFRHVCWAVGFIIYIHGGFEQDTPNIPINIISTIDAEKLFQNYETLYDKMKNSEKKDKKAVDGGKGGYKNKSQYKYKAGGGEKEFKLAHMAHIAHWYAKDEQNPIPEDFSRLVRQISIDKLQEEAKKIGAPAPGTVSKIVKNPKDALCTLFLNDLMRPKEWQDYPSREEFPFSSSHIHELIDEWKMIVSSQPILLKIKPPCKVFGNIHGQYTDLMRFFDIWKSPSDDSTLGDINASDYLFLGNYVDRGSYSLEVICLLMALKIKFPEQVHLLRGAHEDKLINYESGLGEEWKSRLKEDIDDKESIYQKLNEFFEYLPLAASIKNKIFCVHGGIGSRVTIVENKNLLLIIFF